MSARAAHMRTRVDKALYDLWPITWICSPILAN